LIVYYAILSGLGNLLMQKVPDVVFQMCASFSKTKRMQYEFVDRVLSGC